jgi:mono/diheme cytochrome c family protein
MKTHGLVVLLLAVSMTGVASAQEKTGPSKAEIPQVTIEQAIQAAVAKVPGRVHELEVVHKHGKLIWEIEVITADAQHVLVEVDGVTGTVQDVEERSPQKLAGDPAKGKAVYEKHCLSCHGQEGRGNGPMGSLLIPPATDYTESTKGKSDAELLHTIKEGRPGTAMRSFKGWLSKQEMRDVLAYVRVLSLGIKK